jgi:hypothetical protein
LPSFFICHYQFYLTEIMIICKIIAKRAVIKNLDVKGYMEPNGHISTTLHKEWTGCAGRPVFAVLNVWAVQGGA